MTLATGLIAAGAAIAGLLGCVHLLYTFHGNKLEPRDPDLRVAMMKGSPVLTSQTTMWRATKGFNASHSIGVIFFAIIYIHLAIWHSNFLTQSHFLLALGMAYLLALVLLAWRYWFSIPLRGIALSSGLYACGMALLLLGY